MEAYVLFGLIAVLSAFASLYAFVYLGEAVLVRRFASMASQGEKLGVSGLVKWRLRNGFPMLTPLAGKMIRSSRVKAACDEAVNALSSRGVATCGESVLSVALFTLSVLAAFVFAVTRSPVAAVATCICAVVVSYVVSGSLRDKRNEAVREAIPGALESMAVCFESGFTLLQTFKQVADETPGKLGSTFGRSAHVLETGGSARQALQVLQDDECSSDLAFVAVALDVQHESGGSMHQVLEAAGDSVKSELDLRRSLRVQTAQAKLSARIVVVMPFILVALFSLASPDFLMPFFSSVFGYALLALAVIMQVAGVILVNRALSVEGVS